jgi:Starch binding domain
MKTPLGDKVSEAVKSFGTDVKEAVEAVGGRVEGAVDALGKEIDRLGRLIRQAAHGSIVFEVKALTEPGENVYVVGNRPILGEWQPERAFGLDGTSYPVWTARVQLEPRAQIEYKYVRKNADGSFTWEAEQANRVAVAGGVGSEVTVRDEVRWA